jgi:branched-subunit amino acid ABC-type transport system permease component
VSDFLPFVVAGLVSGAVYGLAATGLVLTYRATGVFNFAHGAVGAVGAYAFYDLHTRAGLPWPLALLLSAVAVGVVLGLLLERISAALTDATTALPIVATVGVMLALTGAAALRYGPSAITSRPFLPTGPVRFAGIVVSVDQIVVFVLATALALGLYAFFRLSRLGLAMRGLVSDPTLLGMAGTNPVRTRRASWMIGSALAAVSGIFIAPTLGLAPVLITMLVVQAFGAAAIGGFASLPLTYAGGLVIGLAASLATKYIGSDPVFSGFPVSVPFVVLFAVLVALPQRTRLRSRDGDARRVRTLTPGLAGRLPVLGAALLVFGLAPHLFGARLPAWTSAAAFVIVFASLALLVTVSRQISLAHVSFVALGAATMAHLTTGAGLPWAVGLAGAGLAAVPLGAIVAIPAIRVSGVSLALATFGFAILLERTVYPTGLMFGAGTSGGFRRVPRPAGLGGHALGDTGYFYVVVALAVAACAAIALIQRSRLGLFLRAMGDSSLALSTYGAAVNVTRVLAVCLSAALAGVAGALLAGITGGASGETFPAFSSLLWVTVVVIAGREILTAAVIGATLMVLVPSYLPGLNSDRQSLLFGLAAVAVAIVQTHRDTLAAGARRAARRAAERTGRSPVRARLQPTATWQAAADGERA